nr:sugar phosphate isomerase/epimerase [Caldicoprobacter algeriensis]
MKQDVWGTCKKLADIGYKGIESTGFLFEGDVEANLERLKAIGLQPITYSTTKQELINNIDKVIENAKKIQVPHVSVWYGPVESREQLIEDAKIYNQAGAKLSSVGLKLCYHNHEHEFNTFFNGVSAIDILAEYTDPNNLYFELDCAWITFAGADPVYVLNKMAGRVPAIHIKDLVSTNYPNRESVVFTSVGTGVVKTIESVEAAIKIGVEWVVVEQDRLRNLTAMETALVSYLNLKEAGLTL